MIVPNRQGNACMDRQNQGSHLEITRRLNIRHDELQLLQLQSLAR